MTFLADFETLPPIDPGEYAGISLRKSPAVLEVGAVDRALEHLQQRHSRWHPVEDRTAEMGDTVIANLTRTRRTRLIALPGETAPAPPSPEDDKPEKLENVSIELGASANPPGFDSHLLGAKAGDERAFQIIYPPDYEVEDLKSATVDYEVSVTGLRRQEILPL